MALDSRTTLALLERDAEFEAIDRAVAEARQGAGGLLLIDGPAGVGKTALMDAARDSADAGGLRILTARGAEMEKAFAFGVVRQLFEGVVHDAPVPVDALFAGAARFAAPLLDAVPDGAPATPSEDPFATRHGLYWLTANLAAEAPLALLVDDAHWADAASLSALAHIANRLEGLPIALLVASRSEESVETLEALRRQAAATKTLLPVAPLGEEAAAAVVRSFAPSADDALCRACFRASGGNPFLLHELARSALSGEAGALDPERVADQSPERVTREVAGRLARLSEAASRLARGAAVLGGEVPLRHAAALAGVDQDEAPEAADALVAAGVLGSAEPLEFLHPLIRAAVYDGLGPAARALDHGHAARLLADEGASPERVAAQLLRCPPAGDSWACEHLVAAARLAGARGGSEAAARYLRRALDEPPPPPSRTPILLELAVAEAAASDPEASIAHLREALAVDLPAELRLRATMLLSALLGHLMRPGEAADAVEGQLDALADHPALQATAHAAYANVTRIDTATRPRALAVIQGLRSRVEAGGERDPAVLGTVATEMLMAAEPAERSAAIAERALAGFDWTRMGPDWSGLIATRVLVLAEHYGAALRALTVALEAARERGSVIDIGGALAFRAELYLGTGDLANAEVDARTLLEIATASGWHGGQGFAAAFLGQVLVERDELTECAHVLQVDAGAESHDALTRGYTTAEVLLARGRLCLARGQVEEGMETLRASGRWSTGTGVLNPSGAPWRSLLAHALLDHGRTDEARRLSAEELDLARSFGAPRALAVALRAAARVEGGYTEIRMLREAIELLGSSPAQLERARAHAALGAALRREGAPADAREPLRVAVDLAHRCGAHMLEDQALEELRATGARPRRRLTTGAAALTPKERRIADLAAGGQQNREIAQALWVTTHTVEFHLRNAYRKLGITSRTELEGALGLPG